MWGRGSRSSCARRRTRSSTTPDRRFRRAAMPASSRCCRICAIAACVSSMRSSSVTAISIIGADANTVLAGLPVARVAGGPSVGHAVSAARAVADAGNAGRGTACSSRCCIRRALLARATTIRRASCVVRSAAGSALLAGDIEAAAESEIVDSGLPRATSSSCLITAAALLRPRRSSPQLRPALALVSAGYRNRWGLPRREVVERWRAAGARVLTTSGQRRDRGHVRCRPSAARARVSAARGVVTGIADSSARRVSATMPRITRPAPAMYMTAHSCSKS